MSCLARLRAELWGVILDLQCSSAVLLGVDNLNVVRHVSRIIDGHVGCKHFELTIDGDLLTVIERAILQSSVQSLRISEVKGHAYDDMVAVGRVRFEDEVGNDFADRAADFGRRRVSDLVMDVRRRSVSACSLRYLVVLDLQRFFIAIARAAVNEDGCAGVLLCILLFGLVVGSLLGFLVPSVFGDMVLLVGLALRFSMLMLVFGSILLGSWLTSVLF